MKPALALGASIACAAVAVALVGLDLAYNIEATLEYRAKDGSWVTMARSGSQEDRYAYPSFAGNCGGPNWRLTVHNGQPWSQTLDVEVSYNRPDGVQTAPYLESWSLPSSQSRTHEFTIPAAAFTANSQTDPKSPPQSVSVNVRVGSDIYLGGCAYAQAPEATA